MKKFKFVWLVLILVLFSVVGCNSSQQQTTGPNAQATSTATVKVKVVATIFPLADIAQNIGGPDVEVVTLLPPGSSPHTFEPTPAQMKQLADAQILIQVGAGLDNMAEKLAQSANPDLITVTATDGLIETTTHLEQDSQEQEQQHEQEIEQEQQAHTHQHHGLDPHVWLDPVLVQQHIVPAITAALTQAQPKLAAQFDHRAKTYTDQLEQLHRHILATTGDFQYRSFITFHSVWHYFGLRYDLDDITVESFPSKEPSALWLTQVIKLAQTQKARAVLVEPQVNAKAAEIIAQELNLPVLTVDALGAKNKPGYDSYIGMMQSNLKIMEQALR